MTRLLLTLVLLLALPGTLEAQDRRSLHVGLTCSIAADAADFASTAYAFHRRPDVVEGNFLLGTRRDLGRILVVKGLGALAVNGVAI